MAHQGCQPPINNLVGVSRDTLRALYQYVEMRDLVTKSMPYWN